MTKQYLRILSDEDIQKIHNASLAILENTGMLVDHHKARQMLQEAGAKVDHERKIVKFPPELVEKSLKSLPRTITYAGRNPENDMTLRAGGDVYARQASGEVSYVDLKTGEYRRARIDDVKEWAVLTDALPNINGCAALYTEDVPARTSDIHTVQVLLENQSKHVTSQSFSVKNLRYIIEMMLAVRGSRKELKKRPLFHAITAVISPLFLDEDDVDMMFLAGEYGIPVAICVVPNAGTTGPITICGSFAQGNAELLAAITVAQVAHPGHPIPYYWIPGVSDMATGAALQGAPEVMLMNAALIQLGRELYGLPTETNGFMCEGVICEQSMFQKGSSALMSCLAGGNLLTSAGSVENTLGNSPVQLVLDDEIMAITRRISRGIEINDDTLALEAIARVGPRGTFLADEHTLRYLRTDEHFRPTIFDHDLWSTWYAKGAKGLEQKAREKAVTILEEHEVEPLAEDVVKELRSIVRKADQELAG